MNEFSSLLEARNPQVANTNGESTKKESLVIVNIPHSPQFAIILRTTDPSVYSVQVCEQVYAFLPPHTQPDEVHWGDQLLQATYPLTYGSVVVWRLDILSLEMTIFRQRQRHILIGALSKVPLTVLQVLDMLHQNGSLNYGKKHHHESES